MDLKAKVKMYYIHLRLVDLPFFSQITTQTFECVSDLEFKSLHIHMWTGYFLSDFALHLSLISQGLR